METSRKGRRVAVLSGVLLALLLSALALEKRDREVGEAERQLDYYLQRSIDGCRPQRGGSEKEK